MRDAWSEKDQISIDYKLIRASRLARFRLFASEGGLVGLLDRLSTSNHEPWNTEVARTGTQPRGHLPFSDSQQAPKV